MYLKGPEAASNIARGSREQFDERITNVRLVNYQQFIDGNGHIKMCLTNLMPFGCSKCSQFTKLRNVTRRISINQCEIRK
jgi:hypothetical protein